jgi:glycosyltransferase involved in cell wall biosynthesis
MITGEYPPFCGGLGYYVYHLSKCLSINGYKITVITRGNGTGTYKEIVDNIVVYRSRFLPLYPFHINIHGIFVNNLLREMESNFDLVHLHGHGIPVIKTSLPTIITEHGTAQGFIKNLVVRDINKIDFFSLGLKLWSSLFISIDRDNLEKSNIVTAVSPSCAKEISHYYGISNVEIVNNGVDTKFFVPNQRKREDNYILYAGSFITKKGINDLIDSARILCKNIPESKFILVGKGPLEKSLKKKVNDLNLSNNFLFTGYLSRNDLLDYFQRASLYVLPSYHEGLPTVLLEAMSCALPIIATNVPGNSDVLKEQDVGILVPKKDPVSLAYAIERLLSDNNLREKMGTNGRKKAEKMYDWNVISDQFKRLYQNLIG